MYERLRDELMREPSSYSDYQLIKSRQEKAQKIVDSYIHRLEQDATGVEERIWWIKDGGELEKYKELQEIRVLRSKVDQLRNQPSERMVPYPNPKSAPTGKIMNPQFNDRQISARWLLGDRHFGSLSLSDQKMVRDIANFSEIPHGSPQAKEERMKRQRQKVAREREKEANKSFLQKHFGLNEMDELFLIMLFALIAFIYLIYMVVTGGLNCMFK